MTGTRQVVVTGVAGFIGSHLAEALCSEGHSVVGVDSFAPYYEPAKKRRNLESLVTESRFQLIEADAAGPESIAAIANADLVFHLAAQPGVRASWGEGFIEYCNANYLSLQRVLEAVRGGPRVVFASSSSVYGDGELEGPITEGAPTQPVSPYGASKLAGEELCKTYARSVGVDFVSLRYFTVYGPRQRPDMAFTRFIQAALDNEPLTVFGSGRQVRDFTYVGDVVDGTIRAGFNGRRGEAYNLSGGQRASVLEVLNIVAEVCREELVLNFEDRALGDVSETWGDCSKAQRELGFRPSTLLRDGIAAQARWVAALRATA